MISTEIVIIMPLFSCCYGIVVVMVTNHITFNQSDCKATCMCVCLWPKVDIPLFSEDT